MDPIFANSPGSCSLLLTQVYQFLPWGGSGEVHGLSHQAGLHSFWFLVAHHTRYLHLLRLILSLFKMSYCQEECQENKVRAMQQLTPRRQSANARWSCSWSFNCFQIQQQLSKCSFTKRTKFLRIIQIIGVLLPPLQLPSRPVLECLGKEEVPVDYSAGLASCPWNPPAMPPIFFILYLIVRVLTRGARPHLTQIWSL